jgi:hypothetical protein
MTSERGGIFGGILGGVGATPGTRVRGKEATTNDDGDGALGNLAVDFDHNFDGEKRNFFDLVSCPGFGT